jgi:cytochrome c
MKGSGIVWSDKHIFMYLLNPGKYIAGNKMSYAGMPSEVDRANLIAYLA